MDLLTMLEITGVVTAILYLLFATRRMVVCWIFSIVSSILYFPVFWSSHLYADAVLQIYFVMASIYGWYSWYQPDQRHIEVVSWPSSRHLVIIGCILCCSFIAGTFLHIYTPARLFGYSDALISVTSVVVTILTARKVVESWWYWIVIDLIAAAIFSMRGLGITAGLYLLYSFLAMRALGEWRKAFTYTSNAKHSTVNENRTT